MAADSSEPLKIGVIEFSPLISYDTSRPVGPLFDYAEQILKQAGIETRYQGVSINRSLEQLKNHHLDLVLTLFRSPDRERYVRYSKDPLLQVNNGLCTSVEVKKQPLQITTRLAHVRGTMVPTMLNGLQAVPVSGEKVQFRMLQMMQLGRVDAIFSPKPEIIFLAAHNAGYEGNLFCYVLKGSQMPIHIGYSLQVPEDIVQRIDAQLHKTLKQGNFDLYLKKRLSEAGVPEPDLQTIDPSQLPRSR